MQRELESHAGGECRLTSRRAPGARDQEQRLAGRERIRADSRVGGDGRARGGYAGGESAARRIRCFLTCSLVLARPDALLLFCDSAPRPRDHADRPVDRRASRPISRLGWPRRRAGHPTRLRRVQCPADGCAPARRRRGAQGRNAVPAECRTSTVHLAARAHHCRPGNRVDLQAEGKAGSTTAGRQER